MEGRSASARREEGIGGTAKEGERHAEGRERRQWKTAEGERGSEVRDRQRDGGARRSRSIYTQPYGSKYITITDYIQWKLCDTRVHTL